MYILYKKNLDKGEPKSVGNKKATSNSWMTDETSSALWTARTFKKTNNLNQLAGLVRTGLETTWTRKPGHLPTAELRTACATVLWSASNAGACALATCVKQIL